MTFSTNQVAEAAQVTLRQLQWWDERHVVSPHFENYNRAYDQDNFFKALLVARMRSKGLSLQRIRLCMKSLPLENLQKNPEAVLLIRRKGMRICSEEAAVRAMDLENGPAWVICVAPLLEVLRMHVRKKAAN
jgi:DNA-binding transcriptional MerR regulator